MSNEFIKETATTILASHVKEAFLNFLADCEFDSEHMAVIRGVTWSSLDALAIGCGFPSLDAALKVLDEENEKFKVKP